MEKTRPPRIIVDGRPLMDATAGGVREYAANLIDVLRASTPFEYRVWSNRLSGGASTRLPNKLLNAGLRFLGAPKLDRLAGGGDLFWATNINFISLSPGIPLVLTVHDLSFERYPGFFSPKRRLWHLAVGPKALCRRADAIIAVSDHAKRDLVELYGIAPEKIAVAPPGPALAEPGSLPDGLPKRFILHVGALEPRKNHLALIAAFDLLKKRPAFADLGLVLAGPAGWDNRPVFDAIARSAHRAAIHHLGFVAPETKAALYRAAAVFAFPSFYEGFGMPPLEAMASGAPVVSSFAASLGEVVGDAGLLVDPYRPGELAEALAAILDSPSLASVLRSRGLDRAKDFTWESCARKTADVFSRSIK